MAATTMNIMQVCEAITDALKAKGFFEAGGSDDARLALIDPAVAEASAKIGRELKPSRNKDDHLCTVTADDIPGLVTIVSQREIAGDGHNSTNPDFGVTWSLT